MNKNYRFMFLRSGYENLKKGSPLGCVAISLTDNKSKVTYQVSVCNPSDDFNRAQARQLALGRLIEKPKTATVYPKTVIGGDPTMHDITRAVMLAIESDGDVPGRARKAATAWLDYMLSYSFFSLSDRPNARSSKDTAMWGDCD